LVSGLGFCLFSGEIPWEEEREESIDSTAG
jgi:hypothetical protein